jgi:hypothetical protein
VTAKAPSAASNPFTTQPIKLEFTSFLSKEHALDRPHAAVTRSSTKASRTVVETPTVFADDVSTLSSSSSTTTTATLDEANWESIMDGLTMDDIIPDRIVLSAERNSERLESPSFSWARFLLTEETEDENGTAAPTTISSEEEIDVDNDRGSFLLGTDEWVTFSGFPGFIDTLVYQDTVSL